MPPALTSAFRGILATGLVLLMLFCGFLVLVLAGLESGWAAFGLAVVLAVLPVPVYLAVVLFIDRYEPEPKRMVLITFLYGATIAAFIAILLNTVGEAIVAQELGTEAAEIYGYSISAPIVEETAKGFVLFALYGFFRSEFNGVIDGIVYAALVGLGFAMTENVLYYGRGAAEDGVQGAVTTFVARGLLSPFAHPTFTAMTGIGLGIASVSRSRTVRMAAPLLGLGGAILLHSIWNTSAGSGLFLGAYVLIFVPVVLAIVAVVVVGLRREGRTIETYLRGDLPEPEVEALSSLRARRRWRRAATRVGGRAARKTASTLQHVAAELAFLRAQVDAGTVSWDRWTAARESALRAQLASQRRRLSSLGA